MRQVSLDIANWTVRAVGDLSAVPAALRGKQVPAVVPGCVHTDLIRDRLIPDPLVGMNEHEVQWIGETDWEYRAAFDADSDFLKHDRADLVCDGLDTIVEIRLNGVEVGRAANMFHPHRFDLRPALRPGPNEVSITFRSPLKHIRAEEQRLGKRPVNGDWDPYIFIRKAACNFGWDWAPKLATCGIWKSIRIEAWNMVRIADLSPLTRRVNASDWRVAVSIELELASEATDTSPLEVAVSVAKPAKSRLDDVWREPVRHILNASLCGYASMRRTMIVEVDAIRPTLWQPRPPRPQSHYELTATVYAGKATPREAVATAHRSLGFRDVNLKTPKDEQGTAFVLEINRA